MLKEYAMHVKDNMMFHGITVAATVVASNLLGIPGTIGF